MRILTTACILLCLAASSRGQSCTPPEDAGPHGAGWRSVTIQRGSRSLPCRVYYPALTAGQNTAIDTTGRPFPIVAFGHGFMAQNTYYLSYFEHLASRAYVTIAPQFPDTQHGQLADDLLYCLDWLRTQHGTSTSYLFGTLDTGAAAVSGHSMGGGASLLAASYDARVRVAAPLAPAETTPSAISAMPAIAGAVCLISGSADGITPPSTNQVPMYNAASPCKSLPLLLGGNHTRFMDTPIGDWTDPNGNLSRPDQQLLARRYMTAAFDLFLKGDTCGWHYSYGSLSADSRVTMSIATKALPPRAFMLISPLRGLYSGDVSLAWHRARTLNPRDTVSYTVQLADDVAFTAIFRQIASADTGLTVPDAQLHAMNYWRVLARNSPTTSVLSAIDGFFTHPIPVELVSFTAAVHDDVVRLKWTTASETNNAGFAVERSRDGVDFVQTGFVAGAGNAGKDTEYAFEEPVSDCGYFRLKQIDTDGAFEYSPVLRVETRGASSPGLTIFPAPLSARAHRSASITYSLQAAEHVRLRVHDLSGRLVLSLLDGVEEAGTHSALLPVAGLSPGMYIVSLLTPKERRVRSFVMLH